MAPATVIDLGANTGRFSFIAAKHASYVIALEKDETCVDRIEARIEKEAVKNFTVLIGDLAQPTPDLGVLNREYLSILSRGKSDMVLGLALIHHLCIEANIAMNLVAEMFSLFAGKFAIIEFVPPNDERVIQLLENRGITFSDYTRENFIAAFSIYFDLVHVEKLNTSQRELFLWKKK